MLLIAFFYLGIVPSSTIKTSYCYYELLCVRLVVGWVRYLLCTCTYPAHYLQWPVWS